MKICIYTIGDRVNGFGHVMREITLAGALTARGVWVDFVTRMNTPGMQRLMQTPWSLIADESLDWAATLGPDYDALVIDVELGPSAEFLQAVRPHFKQVVTVCGSGYKVRDPQALRDYSDLVVEQNPVGTTRARTLSGAEYLMIDPRYARLFADRDGPIVVSLGAGDPHGVTLPLVRTLLEARYPLRVVVGSAMPLDRDLLQFVHQTQVYVAPNNLLSILEGARLLVGALGMTAFEAAAAGVPSLLCGWTADHVETAQVLESVGVALSLGLASELRMEAVGGLVKRVWEDEVLWETMSAAGPAWIDGRGVERVADRLVRS